MSLRIRKENRIKCPYCSKLLRLPRKIKKYRVRCPSCGDYFQVSVLTQFSGLYLPYIIASSLFIIIVLSWLSRDSFVRTTDFCINPTQSVENFVRSIQLRNEAMNILANDIYDDTEKERAFEILEEALEDAKWVNISRLNKIYASLGNHYRDEFRKGLELFLKGMDKRRPDSAKAFQGQILLEKFGDFYTEYYESRSENRN